MSAQFHPTVKFKQNTVFLNDENIFVIQGNRYKHL